MVSASLPQSLRTLGIVTLQDLYDCFLKTEIKLATQVVCCGYDWMKIKQELKIVFRKPEDKLSGKKLLLPMRGDKCAEMELVEERFTPKAVHWHCTNNNEDNNKTQPLKDIALVLGPSGSGKTMAALGHLTRPRQPEQKIVTLYTRSNDIYDEKGSCLKNVEQLIRSKLAEYLQTGETLFEGKLDMELALVVDEAGELGEWLGDVENLQSLHSDINKVATSARLIIAGTGVDKFTVGIISSEGGPIAKYRMKALGKTHVRAIVDNMWLPRPGVGEKNKLMATLTGHPIFRSLSSNARAAYYLADALSRRSMWSGTLLNIGEIVNGVAHRYIHNNVLRHLEEYEKFLVAREVFKALHESSQRKYTPHFVDFPKSRMRVLSAFWALVDLNVEMPDDKTKTVFVDKERPFSVSVSSAVHLVIHSMIGSLRAFGTTRSDFEVLCAQNELQKVVMESEKEDFFSNPPGLVTLQKPLPATIGDTTNNISVVPIAAGGKVFLNRVNAPFADVIAPYRLCRCKFIEDACAGESAKLELKDFADLGIVSKFMQNPVRSTLDKRTMRINGALLSALSKSWEERCALHPSGADVASSSLVNAANDTPRQFYPAGQLVGETNLGPQPQYKHYVVCSASDSLVSAGDDASGDYEYKYTDPLEKAVEVVFYTNAECFEIGSTDVVVVSESDTDFEGGIEESKVKAVSRALGIELRANVVLRFLFARDHNSQNFAWKAGPTKK